MPRAIGPGLFELGLEIRHVRIGVAIAFRLAQAHTVDDRGMVERVRNDRILRPQKRLEHPAIGVKGGGIEDGILTAGKGRDLGFQLFVQILRATDEAHRSNAETMAVERRLGRLDQLRPIGQAEIIVGAEIDDMAGRPVRGHVDLGELLRGDDAFALVEPVGVDLGKLGFEVGEKSIGHEGLPRVSLCCPPSIAPPQTCHPGRTPCASAPALLHKLLWIDPPPGHRIFAHRQLDDL